MQSRLLSAASDSLSLIFVWIELLTNSNTLFLRWNPSKPCYISADKLSKLKNPYFHYFDGCKFTMYFYQLGGMLLPLQLIYPSLLPIPASTFFTPYIIITLFITNLIVNKLNIFVHICCTDNYCNARTDCK